MCWDGWRRRVLWLAAGLAVQQFEFGFAIIDDDSGLFDVLLRVPEPPGILEVVIILWCAYEIAVTVCIGNVPLTKRTCLVAFAGGVPCVGVV